MARWIPIPVNKRNKKNKSQPVSISAQELSFACTDQVSLVPFSGLALPPYDIFPIPSEFEEKLSNDLRGLIEAEAIDSQNGNVFDNLIDDWVSKAKADLERQRAEHRIRIMTLAAVRQGCKEDAVYKLADDQTALAKTEEMLVKAEKEFSNRHPETESWRT